MIRYEHRNDVVKTGGLVIEKSDLGMVNLSTINEMNEQIVNEIIFKRGPYSGTVQLEEWKEEELALRSLGIGKTKGCARDTLDWPGISSDLEIFSIYGESRREFQKKLQREEKKIYWGMLFLLCPGPKSERMDFIWIQIVLDCRWLYNKFPWYQAKTR